MNNRHKPAEELEDSLEEVPEQIERTTTKPLPAPAPSNVSPQSGLRETASLIHLIQANMREQTERIGHLQQTHEAHNSILKEIIAKFEAMADIQEDHLASLEEALERMETLAAAYIRMIEAQTNRRAETVTQNTATTQS